MRATRRRLPQFAFAHVPLNPLCMYALQSHRSRYVALAVFTVVLSFGNTATAQIRQIERVIDGDTIVLSDGETVRMIGVDAPESHYSNKLYRDAEAGNDDVETIRALGNLAARYLEAIGSGQRVVLTFDQANTPNGHRDRYGRLLAYVNLTDASGLPLVCLNDVMLDAGYANVYSSYPFGRLAWYRRAEAAARNAGRGLWAADALTGPESRKLLETDEQLYVTRTGTRYHRPGCRSLAHSRIPLSAIEHPERYVACKICKPGPLPEPAHESVSDLRR